MIGISQLGGSEVRVSFCPQLEIILSVSADRKSTTNDSATALVDYITKNWQESPDSKHIVVFLYFDETYALSQILTTENDTGSVRSHYQILCSSLNSFAKSPIFTVFMSTNSNLAVYSPQAQGHWSARTSHDTIGKLQTPIVEMPFDITDDAHLAVEGAHLASDVCQDEFMVRFGRMLCVLSLVFCLFIF